MPERDITSLIRALADPDEAVRAESAALIFRGGFDLVAPVIRIWLGDREVAQYFAGPLTLLRITVGLAVQPGHFDQIRAANGWPRLADVPPDQDAKEYELDFDHGVRLDILTSRDPSGAGAIARYLEKFGEGIQQVEINVSNVDRTTELLRSRFGVQPVYAATRAGANGTRVNFFLVAVPTGAKALIELVQENGCRETK
jgi:hypothetical protein